MLKNIYSVILIATSVACGGSIDVSTIPAPDASDAALDAVPDTLPDTGCVPGMTFCPADSGYSVFGNIAKYRDDCTIEYGGCLDGTPTCRDGQCLPWNMK